VEHIDAHENAIVLKRAFKDRRDCLGFRLSLAWRGSPDPSPPRCELLRHPETTDGRVIQLLSLVRLSLHQRRPTVMPIAANEQEGRAV
jgi:hypothetical protein